MRLGHLLAVARDLADHLARGAGEVELAIELPAAGRLHGQLGPQGRAQPRQRRVRPHREEGRLAAETVLAALRHPPVAIPIPLLHLPADDPIVADRHLRLTVLAADRQHPDFGDQHQRDLVGV